jgi:hypothetical protein
MSEGPYSIHNHGPEFDGAKTRCLACAYAAGKRDVNSTALNLLAKANRVFEQTKKEHAWQHQYDALLASLFGENGGKHE